MSVGLRIKKRRKELGLTVDEVADKLGKNRATVYRYESDEIENLPITIIEPIAKILNVSPSYLMGWNKINEDYNFSTNLIDTYYNGLIACSEEGSLKKHESAILKDHIADLFLRYKELIEQYGKAQRSWDIDKESFSKFYEEKDDPLSDVEIKELYLKQELQMYTQNLADWINALPSWSVREEEKYIKNSDSAKHQVNDNFLTPMAAHNDAELTDEELELMKEDLDDL